MSAKRIVRPAPRKRRGITYKSYNFIDKDPVIYELWELVKGVSFGYIEEESGVSVSCLMSWFYGPTKKPQNATVRAVLRAVGYDYRIVPVDQSLMKQAAKNNAERHKPRNFPRSSVVEFKKLPKLRATG